MNPVLLTLCAALEAAIVCEGYLLPAILLVALYGMFAFTREQWDPHLDMILLMTGPGGLGMLAVLLVEPACHEHYWLMSAGMMAFAGPLAWRYARCIQAARQAGYGAAAFLLDIAGMQAGMALAHFLPTSRFLWLEHSLMLISMLLGMMASYSLRRRLFSDTLNTVQ